MNLVYISKDYELILEINIHETYLQFTISIQI